MFESFALEDATYPELLRKIKNPPKKLYCRGCLDSNVFERCVAVVGSRRMTSYGKKATQKIVRELAGCGVTIVSGFMYGIDACAHEAALSVGGKTIAVMPCGIDYIHPENQTALYETILDTGGLILSEYAGDLRPQLWMYPQRNRIVAGLCAGTLVVEAALNSGSLITAEYTQKFGRPLFVVPGGIFSENSFGIYQLLDLGAKPVDSGFDMVKSLGFDESIAGAPTPSFGQLGLGIEDSYYVETAILDLLKFEPMTINELSRFVDMSFDDLSSKMTLLNIKGVVSEEAGKYYVD